MAQHMAQQNAEGSRDLSTLVDASAELQHLWCGPSGAYASPTAVRGTASRHTAALVRT